MKLKKIASLALAGVMAVSMLAGCATNKPEEKPGEGQGTVTGYSSDFAGYVSEETAKKTYITYADSATDEAALQDALGNLGTMGTTASTLPQTVDQVTAYNYPSMKLVVGDFADTLELANTKLTCYDARSNMWVANKPSETVKVGLLYVIDGTVDVKKAVKQVAEKVDDELLEKLANANFDNNTRYTFDYTVSVSVVNKAVTTLTDYTGSANFIAVTVTRVPTAA